MIKAMAAVPPNVATERRSVRSRRLAAVVVVTAGITTIIGVISRALSVEGTEFGVIEIGAVALIAGFGVSTGMLGNSIRRHSWSEILAAQPMSDQRRFGSAEWATTYLGVELWDDDLAELVASLRAREIEIEDALSARRNTADRALLDRRIMGQLRALNRRRERLDRTILLRATATTAIILAPLAAIVVGLVVATRTVTHVAVVLVAAPAAGFLAPLVLSRLAAFVSLWSEMSQLLKRIEKDVDAADIDTARASDSDAP